MERSTDTDTREFVLCFDGTGYKFHGDEVDSNVLKIYRMLDRNDARQYHYYQSGFGTCTTAIWQAGDVHANRLKRWMAKTKDAAVGTTFDEHVMDAYRFLMRFYSPGDGIYIFGFSRGAYVARMLAEMLDHVGLLEAGNEGKVRYIWSKFSKWAKCVNIAGGDEQKKAEEYRFMKALRETFCRPVSQIRFLGLFDTVNSIPRFEVIRNKFAFPYTAKTSARVIRHAVSIDEHRAKFREDLLSDTNPNRPTRRKSKGQPEPILQGHCSGEAFYRPVQPGTLGCDENSLNCTQDIEEVWFAGCHADIGGGLKLDKDEEVALSHVPLVWMVQEAQRAGLQFNPEKMKLFHCYDDTADISDLPRTSDQADGHYGLEKTESNFQRALWRATTSGHIHDFLRYGHGVPWATVASWRVVEYLPFRRMGLQNDGSWKPIRWPLPLGEKRDIPKGSKIHGSVIRRMKLDPNYRPGNVLKQGKGKRKRPFEDAISGWKVYANRGCPVREIYCHS